MNLENCNVSITYSSIIVAPPSTTIRVSVSEEVIPGVNKVKGSFELTFDQMFFNHADPALITAINEKLALVPE